MTSEFAVLTASGKLRQQEKDHRMEQETLMVNILFPQVVKIFSQSQEVRETGHTLWIPLQDAFGLDADEAYTPSFRMWFSRLLFPQHEMNDDLRKANFTFSVM